MLKGNKCTTKEFYRKQLVVALPEYKKVIVDPAIIMLVMSKMQSKMPIKETSLKAIEVKGKVTEQMKSHLNQMESH